MIMVNGSKAHGLRLMAHASRLVAQGEEKIGAGPIIRLYILGIMY